MKQLTCDEVRELLPAYALGALDAAERAGVDAALSGCDGCAQLLIEYRLVDYGLLHITPEIMPPPDLRSAIMRQAGILPVAVAQKPRHVAIARQPGVIEQFKDWLVGTTSVPRGALAFMALAGVCALGLLVNRLGVVSSQSQLLGAQVAAQEAQARELQGRIDQQTVSLQQMQLAQATDRRIVAVAADGSARTVQIANKQLPANTTVFLRFSDNNQAAVLSVTNLPALSDDQAYELWLFDAAGKPIPSTLFTQVASAVLVETPATLGSYKNFAVTIEPRAGSQLPTGPVVAISY